LNAFSLEAAIVERRKWSGEKLKESLELAGELLGIFG
jgi:hypothetical protein